MSVLYRVRCTELEVDAARATIVLDVRGVHPDASMLRSTSTRAQLASTAARLLLDSAFHPVRPARRRTTPHPWIAARCLASAHREWVELKPTRLGAWPREWIAIASDPMPWSLDVIDRVDVGERRVMTAADLRALGVRIGDGDLDPEYPYFAADWRITSERAGADGLAVGRVWDSTAYCD